MPSRRKKLVTLTVLLAVGVLLGGLALGWWLVTFGQRDILSQSTGLIAVLSPGLFFLSLVLFVLTALLLRQAKVSHRRYLADDSDANLIHFQKANRRFQEAMFFNTAAIILLVFQVTLEHRIILNKDGLVMTIPLLGYLGVLVLGLQQAYALHLYRQIRQADFPIYPLGSELQQNVYQYDEGELQAHQSAAYQTLLQLNYYIFPSLFILLSILSAMTGQVQLLAMILVLVLYLYTSWRTYWLASRYYR